MRVLPSCLLLFLIALLSINCKRRFPCNIPPAVNCAITLDKFLGNCYTTDGGTTHINYTADLVVWYYDDCAKKKIEFKKYTLTSPTTPVKQPISVNAQVPDRGPFWIEVTIMGEQCSTCANQYGGTSNDVVNNCPRVPVSGGIQAAYPRWNGYFVIQTPSAALTLDRISRIRNVPNSCGCVVPY
jgi:hypothetical protein